MQGTLERLGVPTSAQIQLLIDRVEQLNTQGRKACPRPEPAATAYSRLASQPNLEENAMSDKSDKKDLQNDLKESASKIWLAGLGALAAAEEEGSKLSRTWSRRARSGSPRAAAPSDEVQTDVKESGGRRQGQGRLDQWDTVGDKFDDVLAGALKRFGVPAREEIATLTKRVEELTALVESLKQPKKAAAPKAADAKAEG